MRGLSDASLIFRPWARLLPAADRGTKRTPLGRDRRQLWTKAHPRSEVGPGGETTQAHAAESRGDRVSGGPVGVADEKKYLACISIFLRANPPKPAPPPSRTNPRPQAGRFAITPRAARACVPWRARRATMRGGPSAGRPEPRENALRFGVDGIRRVPVC